MEVGILIGTHGYFGEEIVKSAQMIIGQTQGIVVSSLTPELSFEDYFKKTEQLILESGFKQIIGIVDLFGGTPSNVLTVLGKKYGFKVCTGLNLAGLIDCVLKVQNGDTDVAALCENFVDVVKESAVITEKML